MVSWSSLYWRYTSCLWTYSWPWSRTTTSDPWYWCQRSNIDCTRLVWCTRRVPSYHSRKKNRKGGNVVRSHYMAIQITIFDLVLAHPFVKLYFPPCSDYNHFLPIHNCPFQVFSFLSFSWFQDRRRVQCSNSCRSLVSQEFGDDLSKAAPFLRHLLMTYQ